MRKWEGGEDLWLSWRQRGGGEGGYEEGENLTGEAEGRKSRGGMREGRGRGEGGGKERLTVGLISKPCSPAQLT